MIKYNINEKLNLNISKLVIKNYLLNNLISQQEEQRNEELLETISNTLYEYKTEYSFMMFQENPLVLYKHARYGSILKQYPSGRYATLIDESTIAYSKGDALILLDLNNSTEL